MVAVVRVLVVVVIVALLTALLWPSIVCVRPVSLSAVCADHQKRILTAIIAYEQESNARIIAYEHESNAMSHIAAPARDAREARYETVRAFARVAVARSLPDDAFRCRADPTSGPDRSAKRDVDAVAWGGRAAHHVAFAYDWAAPAESAADRVLLADRTPCHHGVAVVCYADSHTGKAHGRNGARTGGHRTEDASGAPAVALLIDDASPTATEDSIYDDVGDDGDPLTPGKGSATRAWVK